MDILNPVVDRKFHDQMATAIKKAVGEENVKAVSVETDEEDFDQTVITLTPIFSKGKTEYEVIHELSTILYCSGLFLPYAKPLYPAWYSSSPERLLGLINGDKADYLTLIHEKTASERILVDVDLDTSRLESDNVYTVYLTPMTRA